MNPEIRQLAPPEGPQPTGQVAPSDHVSKVVQEFRLAAELLEARFTYRLERELLVMTWRLIFAALAVGGLVVLAVRL
jgi:hypothetical protein